MLRPNELYLTPSIRTRLLEFITGQIVDNGRPAKFIKKNIQELRRYIERYNGEHGRGVNFNTYPYIWKVQATKNFIVLHIRASNYSGYEQWYINYGNGFKRVRGEKNTWIE